RPRRRAWASSSLPRGLDHGLGARDRPGVAQCVNNLLPDGQSGHENCEPWLSLTVEGSSLNTLPAISSTCPRMPHVPGT
ncbi:hypothetical protein KZ302_26705, partial [Escherichia coli]|uniref:hypothetical protein n=1 Tax=Escherichia coli TaxID=562 RepID=UPI001EDBC6D1